jgi:hypothetical protein
MKLFLSFLIVAAVACFAVAADLNVTGKWSGTLAFTAPDGGTQNSTAFAVFKQNGKLITGTGGPDESTQWPIQNGKIEGNHITGEVQSEGNGRSYKLDLIVENGRITGTVITGSEGQTVKGKMDLSRVKE